MTVPLDDGVSAALSGIGPRLGRIAACTLGLVLALCLAGLAGLLTLDTVAAALGFVAAGGLIGARAVVREALERVGRLGGAAPGAPDSPSGRGSLNGTLWRRGEHMQVQVNTDDNVEGRGELVDKVGAKVAAALSRFADRLTRVEVHLGDGNAGKSGAADKRCMMEARPSGQQPVAVTHKAATLEEACGGAAERLGNLLESRFGRLDDREGAASVRDNDRR